MNDKIILKNDDGKEVEFNIIEETKFREKKYILIKNNEEEYLILKDKATPDADESIYELIADEEEEAALLEIFEELLND